MFTCVIICTWKGLDRVMNREPYYLMYELIH
jgi:hypothetical protein